MTRIEIKEKDIITTGGDGMYTEDDDLAILVRDKNKLEQLKQQILQDFSIIEELRNEVSRKDINQQFYPLGKLKKILGVKDD